ncbi:MAG: tetratricopeptide repeat protein [Treponema sp.]|jgi:TolA-binding protein|nr:tetratricopeptide repeat protein [Treponema sp.]
MVRCKHAVFALVLALVAGSIHSQSILTRLQEGISLYSQGRWLEAVSGLRRVQADASSSTQRAEALYWIGLAELFAGEYEAALEDMEILEQTDPGNRRIQELPYHKGRGLYHLGRYDEAVVLLKTYADSVPTNADGSLNPQNASKKAAALYWTGECLYSMGLLDKANEVFLLITDEYPYSPKYEASVYRMALINQKKVEAELLALLKWSHEESLKTMEEYQRREHSYDQALIAYQKRIADMLKDTRLSDLENENAQYRQQLTAADERIRQLEGELYEALGGLSAGSGRNNPDPVPRLNSLRSSALELRDALLNNGVLAAPGSGR